MVKVISCRISHNVKMSFIPQTFTKRLQSVRLIKQILSSEILLFIQKTVAGYALVSHSGIVEEMTFSFKIPIPMMGKVSYMSNSEKTSCGWDAVPVLVEIPADSQLDFFLFGTFQS